VTDIPETSWKPRFNVWVIALTVTMATFMEVLDATIANVALPHIAGNLSATQEEATWVLTSYLAANAIVVPISAWLALLVGRKRFYMSCVALFTISSLLCGLAPNLEMLILFRVLQGIGGGGLLPSEQAILADTFRASQRGMAFAIYGMAVVVAPAIGPTLGGWVTDNFTWRWVFYINVPIGVLSLFLTSRIVEDPPFLKREQLKRRSAPVDYVGLGLVSIAICSLQIVLGKGQELDWLSSSWIVGLAVLAFLAFGVWIVWEWYHQNPVVDIRLFRRRNFATAMFFSFVVGAIVYSTAMMIPQFLQLQLGYSAMKAGEAVAGVGIVMMFMLPIAGALVTRVDPRLLMAVGFMSVSAALYSMATHMSLGMDFGTAAMLRTYQMCGVPFILIPQMTAAYIGVPPEKNNQVSSINSFVQSVGGGIGIALVNIALARSAQVHQSYLVAHATPGAPAYEALLEHVKDVLAQTGAGRDKEAYGMIAQMLTRQATTMAYVEVVSVLAVVILCLTPLVLVMEGRPRPKGQIV